MPFLATARRDLLERFQDRPSVVEFCGSHIRELLPASLLRCPVWYIRLDDTWVDRFEHMIDGVASSVIGATDEPWSSARYLEIRSSAPRARSPDDAQIRFLEGNLYRTTSDAYEAGCVLVVFECDSHLCLTSYPADWLLGSGLLPEATDALSHFTPGFLQAQVRALQDGFQEKSSAWPSTLAVHCLLDNDEASKVAAARARLEALEKGTLAADAPQAVNCHRVDDGAVGLLQTIVNYVPRELRDEEGLWIRLTLPHEMYSNMAKNPTVARVRLLKATEHRPSKIALVITSGRHWPIIGLPATASAASRRRLEYVVRGRRRSRTHRLHQLVLRREGLRSRLGRAHRR